MKYLEAFVQEYKKSFDEIEVLDDSVSSKIKQVRNILLNDEFLPSVQLKALFDKLLRRSKYPMEVAIVGQFSSGKSTFLNALLSKDILPTGITPVTSKVNYINYGSEYKLKVVYKDGSQEYHSLEHIAAFTDQRQSVEDIKYLSLYAPMQMLKDISFVDTPGLNSLSNNDTQITKKILRDVDGIIWLSLLDNAAKHSEEEVLKEYLPNFKDKSLCVLNQKDKFTQDQVKTSLDFVSSQFSEYFSKVIPISAKQALDSRVNQKTVLLENELLKLQSDFKEQSFLHVESLDLDFFQDRYKKFSANVENIKKEDKSNNLSLMKESNIQEVLEFIENTIRPQALDAKRFAIEKDLNSICDILIQEYRSILGVYESLEDILDKKEDEVLEAFDKVFLKHSQALDFTKDKIETILETISDVIYKNIKNKNDLRYEKDKNILGMVSINELEYESYFIDKDSIMQELFFENQYIDKQIKTTINYFKNIQNISAEDFREVFRILKHSVQTWQEPYEHISKHREIASDREFADTRQFVAKVYENILLPYHRAILENIKNLHVEFSYFNAFLGTSYKNLSEQSIYLVQERLEKQIESYKSDPLKNSINPPDKEAILEILKKSFSFEKIEPFLSSRRNYLFKIIEESKKQFKDINEDRLAYVVSKKQIIKAKISKIEQIYM